MQGFGGAEGFGLAGLSAFSLLQEALAELGEDGVGVVVKAIVDDFFDGFADAGFDELTEFVDGEVFDLHGVGGGWGAIEGSAGFIEVWRSLRFRGGACFFCDRPLIFATFERRQSALCCLNI